MKRTCYPLLLALLGTLCVNGQVYAQDYELGRAAYIRGDYKAAHDILKPLAESGDAEAQKMMGIFYDYGHGVPADVQEAMQWYIRSAEQGQTAVQYQVGAKYFKGEGIPRDYVNAAKWWERAATAGQVDAQFNLGVMYFRGLGVPQDDSRATHFFQMAADQDHAHSQYSLAVMYAFARGVAKDYDKALSWFLKAADKNVAQAQYNLGVFYENGYGVDTDPVQAKQWYERAAAQGLNEAAAKLNMLASIGTPATVPTIASTNEGPSIQLETLDKRNSSYALYETSTNGIKREDWVLQQREDSYTLQIGSVTNEDDLVKFLQGLGIEHTSAYIQVEIDGLTRYNAFYGAYPSYAEAEQAVAGLPDTLRQLNPWIRNFGILKKMLN